MLGKATAKLKNRFAIEIPLASLVPEKFIPLLITPTVSLYTQLQSVVSEADLLTVSASIEWTESSSYSPSSTSPPSNATQAPSASKLMGSGAEASSQGLGEELHPSTNSNESVGVDGAQPRERLRLWVEDRLLNELLEHFRWETEWIEERIPM